MRAQLLELVQFGVESTLGDGAAANKRIQGLMVDIDPDIPTEDVMASGTKSPVGTVVGKEMCNLNISGLAGFNELAYLMASCVCVPVITTPAGNGTFTLALGSQSSGTFTLTFNGQTTATIAYDANGAAVTSALEALSTIAVGEAVVTGSNPNFTIALTGSLYRSPLAITADFSSLGTPGNASITATAASTSRRFTMTPSATAADTFNSFSVEKGQGSSLAAKVNAVRCDDLELKFVPRKSVDLKAKAVGQEVTDGVTITAGPTSIAYKPLNPKSVNFYIASTEAGLVSAAQIKPLEMTWKIGNRHTPVFTLDSAEASFQDYVEKSLNPTGQIILEHTTAVDAYMTGLRAGTTYYMRIEVTGETIESGYAYRLMLTMPVQFQKNARNPNQDTHCSVLDWRSQYDGSFILKVIIDTALTAL